MRTTVIQMAPGASAPENMQHARALITAAVRADRPDLVILPEMWSCLGGTRDMKFAAAETLPGPDGMGEAGPLYSFLSGMARTHGIILHGGSIGERHGDRLFNTSLVFDAHGHERARYRKIHLFDVTTPGGEGYRESDTYEPGSDIVTVPLSASMTAGLAICYDIRFPALFHALRARGANMLLVPAAFTVETGLAHWETLLRARAIETQCWMVACGTTGTHMDENGQKRRTYGHSMIIDPWGTIVAQVSDGPGWSTARLERDVVETIRGRMPVMAHHRLSIHTP
ncbi:carbon-nitrogen hydrolase family protein [Komagataeibacter rhaeticus]|uniref:Carbon-nitrogen hydrolase family protein n=1 Tax=Komagataeibacter rhaeticus TaxID=215221 RepID=A0A181CE40_9PROT|nr:carbon-nitrogen hydrolase family protein [Komagataeibacter rhaeticus]ATU74086.1 carbon-nitrogen hydrolase family protein [Komagataeibacter xylinus]QIP36469.1 carbon-nitrogen hydrolase family protein [Komagataeibacter rhaeticus]QOC46239.1 carbon-nitrogen hydrolase family protein [Komagataeibacter rhaeticus]WPP21105.1 carbon-nitrogen hydrolase family protein [Komagataeibacter rhaeticus]SAY49830.1 2-oxoglutaramate amidase [Komagataeibacter rhaeticus]